MHVMYTFETALSRFAALLDSEGARLDPALRFRHICRRLGLPRRSFDRRLFRELGFRGEEILAIYRQSAHKMD